MLISTRASWLKVPILLALALAAAASAVAAEPAEGNVAPYYPTPLSVARLMLEAGDLAPDELHYDLGSGDGRLVILAARDFAARSVGFEIDEKLVESSRRQIEEMEIGDLARIEQTDLFKADLSKPDLVTLYLLPRALKMLRPLLEKQLKAGARVVSHDFAIPGWDPDETIEAGEDPEIEGLPHTIYVYRR